MNSEDVNPWKILSSEEKYDNAWINVVEHKVINPGGGLGIYGTIHFKTRAIGIIVLDDELNTWLVGQYRFPLRRYSWEIPEGGGAPDTDPLESAKRELKEETGITAERWTKIQTMHLSNSASDELAIIYFARNLRQGKPSPDETEELRLRKVPFEEACQMVLSGEITDSLSVAAILKIRLMLELKEIS